MPMYDYRCENEHVFEALVPADKTDLPRPCPDCGTSSRQVWLTAPGLVGPVFSDVDKYEAALLTKKQRAAGVRITSKRDLDALEAVLQQFGEFLAVLPFPSTDDRGEQEEACAVR